LIIDPSVWLCRVQGNAIVHWSSAAYRPTSTGDILWKTSSTMQSSSDAISQSKIAVGMKCDLGIVSFPVMSHDHPRSSKSTPLWPVAEYLYRSRGMDVMKARTMVMRVMLARW